jgi:branched-chain amino acid transport system ATP-binding protein
MTAVLEVEDLDVRFGGVRAVEGVTLTLREGQLHGLVGPNGSGKTTLVNAISRVGPVSAGRVRFLGTDLLAARPHTLSSLGVARTFQAVRLVPTLTVRENVLLAAEHVPEEGDTRRRGRPRAASATDAALQRLELDHVAGWLPGALPYGVQRRVEIARAVSSRPRLLLLDEPVAGMNRQERVEIADVIRTLCDDGLCTLLIEHDLRLLVERCDELIVMHSGRCVARGEPRATAARPEVQEAYMGARHVHA